MNYARVFLAAIGSFVTYFAFGGVVFATMPWMKTEFEKYPNLYRPHDSMMKVMPAGMGAIFVSILAITVLYARMYRGETALAQGAHSGAVFGLLIGVFVVCAFVIHNWVNLNIGLKLTAIQSVAYFVQWVVVCTVIGMIYRLPAMR